MASDHERNWRWVPWTLLVTILGFAVLAAALDLGGRLGLKAPHPTRQPQPSAQDVSVEPQPSPPPVAVPANGPGANATKVRAAIADKLRDGALGPRVAVLVSDLRTGKPIYRSGPRAVTPASTMKLLTSTAALAVLGPEHRFTTTVLKQRRRLTLVGGGDPLLAAGGAKTYPARASLADLADQVAAQLPRGERPWHLEYDVSLFTGPTEALSWPGSYVPSVVAPITPLWVNQAHARGVGFVPDPAGDAAKKFARMLTRRGLRLVGEPVRRTASAGAVEIAAVHSPPLAAIISHTLAVSDNNAAEVLAHQVGLAKGAGGSFVGGATAVRRALRGLGVPLEATSISDGSGLSRNDRVTPESLVAVLRLAAAGEQPELRSIITGLPVAGYSGSLTWRFDSGAPAGKGRVRAKTGTLTGVHGLAGVITDVEGTPFAFVIIADKVPVDRQLTARIRIDQAAAALAACSCGQGTP